MGSWAEINVDAGVYSRMLMSNAKRAAEQTAAGADAPQTVLIHAHQQTNAQVIQPPDPMCFDSTSKTFKF